MSTKNATPRVTPLQMLGTLSATFGLMLASAECAELVTQVPINIAGVVMMAIPAWIVAHREVR